jgi:hypothetical protein
MFERQPTGDFDPEKEADEVNNIEEQGEAQRAPWAGAAPYEVEELPDDDLPTAA